MRELLKGPTNPEREDQPGQSKVSDKLESPASGPDLPQSTKKFFRWQMAVRAWNQFHNTALKEDGKLLTQTMEDRLIRFTMEDLLFYFSMDLEDSHQIKKNSRNIVFNKKLGHSVLTKSALFERTQAAIIANMQLQARAQKITKPFEGRLWLMAHMYIPEDRYYTRAGKESETLPDLTNLMELYQDCLQTPKVAQTGRRKGRIIRQGAGIITNDSHIDSIDGSRRFPGAGYKVELFLLKYRGHASGPSSSTTGRTTSHASLGWIGSTDS